MLKKIVCSSCGKILYSAVSYCPFCGSAQNFQAERTNDSHSDRLTVSEPQVETEVPEYSAQSVESSIEEREGREPETKPKAAQPTPAPERRSESTSPNRRVSYPQPKTTKDNAEWKKVLNTGIGKIFLALGISAVAIAIMFLSLSGGSTPETPDPTQTNLEDISNPDFVKNYLDQSPDKYDALSIAQHLEKTGSMGKAFLIYRYAERQGVGEAATAIARFYDPTISSKINSPLSPNANKALELYKKGVDQGDPAASEGLNRLVNSMNL